MYKFKLILIILGLSSALLGIGMIYAAKSDESAQDTAVPQASAPLPDPVAVVNGQPISRDTYEIYAEQRQRQIGDIDSGEARQALVNELVTQELLVQKAAEQNLAQDPQVIMQLELLRRNLLATAALRKQLEEHTPSEETINKEYEQAIADMQDQEYKASHILVESEEEANAIIEELDKGADFAELADTHSKDTADVAGGDLGWFTPDVMVPPFGEAVTQLEKGEYTEQPVQTPFGWHVIKLEDVREATPPSLEELRPQITQMIQSRMINDYLETLHEQAEVEIKVE